MRIQLILTLLLFSFNAMAVDDKEMQELFKKYDSVMDHKKVELIDEVFTSKFIQSSGGKKELIEKIKGLPAPEMKLQQSPKMSWKKGLKGEIYFVKLKGPKSTKEKSDTDSEAEFIVLNIDGKLRIDGTISDGN